MRSRFFCVAFGMGIFVLSGCYTVVMEPRSAADVEEEGYVRVEEGDDEVAAGRKTDDDFYRYPGTPDISGSWDRYGGYPFYGVGYPSVYGAVPYYGYAYGPVYYGYDPYYRSNSGWYVPVGYELVTEDELEDLRASRRALSELEGRFEGSGSETAEGESRKEQRRREEEAWQRRLEPRVRSLPVPAAHAPAVSPASAGQHTSQAGSPSTGSGAGNAAKKKKTNARPRKIRR